MSDQDCKLGEIEHQGAVRDRLVARNRERRNSIIDMYNDKKIDQADVRIALLRAQVAAEEAQQEILDLWIENFTDESWVNDASAVKETP